MPVFFDEFERYLTSSWAKINHILEDIATAPGGFLQSLFPVVPEVHEAIVSGVDR